MVSTGFIGTKTENFYGLAGQIKPEASSNWNVEMVGAPSLAMAYRAVPPTFFVDFGGRRPGELTIVNSAITAVFQRDAWGTDG